jgi:8-oxo-dGTP diphosphatase
MQNLLSQAEKDRIQKLVVGAFIMRDGKFLIVKRSETDDFLPGLHEIPSGGVDEGEDIETALRREVLEETGLAILSIYRYVNHFDYISGSGKRARQFNFLVSVEDNASVVLNPEEHSEYIWSNNQDGAFDKLFNLSDKTKTCLIDALRILEMTQPEPQRPYVGVHLILIKDDKILLMKRTVKDESFGKYALVAGKVDVHESPRIALARETLEEVGVLIQPEDLKHIATIHHAKTDYKAQKLDVIEFYFMPTKWEGVPTLLEPDKASELAFFPLDNLPSPVPNGLCLALNALNGGHSFIEN